MSDLYIVHSFVFLHTETIRFDFIVVVLFSCGRLFAIREEQREDPAVLLSLLRIMFGQHGGTVIEKAKKMDGQSTFKGQEGEKKNSFRLKGERWK